MNINLLAEGLDGSLAEIVAKLQSLIDSFWIYIVIALAAVVVRIATKKKSTPAT